MKSALASVLNRTQNAVVLNDDATEGRQTVQVSGLAHTAFASACKTRSVDRSMFKAASQLLLWFVRQSQIVQTAVLADVDVGMELAYAEALRRLADELESGQARSGVPNGDVVGAIGSQPAEGAAGRRAAKGKSRVKEGPG